MKMEISAIFLKIYYARIVNIRNYSGNFDNSKKQLKKSLNYEDFSVY